MPDVELSRELKVDVEQLFALDSTSLVENIQPWDLLLTKEARRHWEAAVPSAAEEILVDGFQRQQGIWSPKLRREQLTVRRLWQREERVIIDSFRCVLMDFAYSGGGGLEIPFDYRADMTQPAIPYDERVAGVVEACLRAES